MFRCHRPGLIDLHRDEGLSPSRSAEIIELLCEAMRFALAENAGKKGGRRSRVEKGGKRGRRGADYRGGRGKRAKDANSIVSVIGNGLCVLVSRVLMMESRVERASGGLA